MKKNTVLFTFLFLFSALQAQQWVAFSQQSQYKLFTNASLAGSNSQLHATIAHRSQYTFLTKRAIASQFAAFSMPIVNKNYGVGISIVNDFIGYQRYTSVVANGAYHLYINKSSISFGLGVGVINMSINGNKLRAAGGSYENEIIIHNDEKIPNANSGGSAPTFSFGVSYEWSGLELGFAMQNINSPKIKLLKSSSETNIFLDRTINANIGYVIEVKKLSIKPMLSYYTDLIKHQMQVEIISEINNIYFGLAFRGYSGLNNDAFIALLGIKIKDNFRIGYSYDLNVSGMSRSNFGSHELSLNYTMPQKFSTKSKGNLLFNPRFL